MVSNTFEPVEGSVHFLDEKVSMSVKGKGFVDGNPQ
jgi:hypothetical protein